METNAATLKKSPIIAVVRHVPENKIIKVVEALFKGGIRNVEITFDETSNTSRKIKAVVEEFGDKMFIGAGTVLTIKQAEQAIESGAKFIFAPNLNKKLINFVKDNNILMIPGVFTPTEIYRAHSLGCNIVKVFPANVLGANYIKELKGPMPFIDYIPTGGVNLNNICDFFNTGAIAVGVGSTLLDLHAIENEEYETITEISKRLFLKIYSESKGGSI